MTPSSRDSRMFHDEGGRMMQNVKRRYALLACFLALFGAMTTGAQSISLGLTVTPGKFEATMPIGSSYNLPITVNNSAASAVHVLTSLTDFAVSDNGDYQFEKVGTRPYSLLKWAAIKPREFDIAPGTTQQVQLTLSVPSDDKLSGEYAGIVFFQTRPERHGGGVAFSARVAAKIYVTIPGTQKIEGAITKMTSVKAPGGQVYRVIFRNTGNAHVYCRGQLIVQKGGTVVYQVPLADNVLVERGGERTIQVQGKSLEPGSYQAIATLDYGGKTETGGEINFDVH